MTTSGAGDGAMPVTELTYTEASRELDAIVQFFEQREVDVDQLVVQLERATAIVDELDRRVRKTRAQVEELVPRLEAANRGLDTVDAGGDDDQQLDEEVDHAQAEGDGFDEDGDDQALF
jgi:exodeoxyribonuclease VII small subunit